MPAKANPGSKNVSSQSKMPGGGGGATLSEKAKPLTTRVAATLPHDTRLKETPVAGNGVPGDEMTSCSVSATTAANMPQLGGTYPGILGGSESLGCSTPQYPLQRTMSGSAGPRVTFNVPATPESPSGSTTGPMGVMFNAAVSTTTGAMATFTTQHTLPQLMQFNVSSSGNGADKSTTASGNFGASTGKRSLTLLERRNNKERNAMSFSCLSGLSAETIQESVRESRVMHDTMLTPQRRGWSKTVASAALMEECQSPIQSPPFNVSLPPMTPSVRRKGSAAPAVEIPSTANDNMKKSPPFGVLRAPSSLRVISYNILADRLVSTDRYPSCGALVLSEEYRLELIKQEIQYEAPDILLLQEISVGVFETKLGSYLRGGLDMDGRFAVITDKVGNVRSQAEKTPYACGVAEESLNTPRHTDCSGVGKKETGGSSSSGVASGSLPLLATPMVDRRRSGQQPPSTPARPEEGKQRFSRPQFTSLSTLGITDAADSGDGQESTASIPPPPTPAASKKRKGLAGVATPVRPVEPAEAGEAQGEPPSVERRAEMDGVSIFFRRDRFQLLEEIPIYFNTLAQRDALLTPPERKKLQANSHNVALITVLKDTAVSPTHIYVVASVHLIWQHVEAQLWQAHHLIRAVEETRRRYSTSLGTQTDTRPPSCAVSPMSRTSMMGSVEVGHKKYNSFRSSTGVAAESFPLEQRRSSHTGTAISVATDTASVPSSMATDQGSGGVTCIIGGDFNSERSSAVLEFLRTGEVPAGSAVMGYWSQSKMQPSEEMDSPTQGSEPTLSSVPSPPRRPPTVGKRERAGSDEKKVKLEPVDEPGPASCVTPCKGKRDSTPSGNRQRRRTLSPPPKQRPCEDDATDSSVHPCTPPQKERSTSFQGRYAESLITLLGTNGGDTVVEAEEGPGGATSSTGKGGRCSVAGTQRTMSGEEGGLTGRAQSRTKGVAEDSTCGVEKRSQTAEGRRERSPRRRTSPEALGSSFGAESASHLNRSRSHTASEFGSVLSGCGSGYHMRLAQHSHRHSLSFSSSHHDGADVSPAHSLASSSPGLFEGPLGCKQEAGSTIPSPQSWVSPQARGGKGSMPVSPASAPRSARALDLSQRSSTSQDGDDRGLPDEPPHTRKGSDGDFVISGAFRHALRLCDAYAPYCHKHPNKVSAMNPSTNMEGKVLDHILYEDHSVACGSVLRLGDRVELPTSQIPSDHYMVGAVFVPLDVLRRHEPLS